MNLQFDSLAELERMIHAMGYVRRDTVAVDLRVSDKMMKDLAESMQAGLDREVAELVEHGGKAQTLTHVALVDNPPDANCTVASEVQAEPPKRKRRTKAEIEAEKAAQAQAADSVPVDADEPASVPQASPLDNLKAEPVMASNGDPVHVEIAEMAALFDGTDRLAHINEGRDFIAKHGFPTYNETMQLADVPANIAGHTPEQVSRHRAAMAWKAAQLAGG